MVDRSKDSPSELVPRLGLFSATMVVMGTIIGSGIFKKTGPMSLKLQSPDLVLWCWLAAGVITLFGALTYAEIASRWAQTGGLYAYLRVLFGPFYGYLFGWACFSVIQSASIASIAYVFAEAFRQAFPSVLGSLSVPSLAAGVVLLLTFVNGLGILFGAVLENIFTVLKILGLLTVTLLAFLWSPAPVAEPLTPLLLKQEALLPAFFSAMIGAFWAYDGLNNIGFIGGEVKNARQNLPRALILGITGILVVYLLVNWSFFHALSFPEILNLAFQKDQIFAVGLLQKTYGASWASFVAILILVSTLGATNGSILASARIYFSMARDGLFFNFLGQAHPKTKAPLAALILQGIWACGLIFMGSFDELTDQLIFASFIFYGLGAVGLLRSRSTATNYTGFRVPSAIPLIYAFFCFSLVLVTLARDPLESLKGLALILLGVPLYFVFQKNSASLK